MALKCVRFELAGIDVKIARISLTFAKPRRVYTWSQTGQSGDYVCACVCCIICVVARRLVLVRGTVVCIVCRELVKTDNTLQK